MDQDLVNSFSMSRPFLLIRMPTGFYDPFRRSFNRMIGRSAVEQIAATSVAAGAASGIVGGEFLYDPRGLILIPFQLASATHFS